MTRKANYLFINKAQAARQAKNTSENDTEMETRPALCGPIRLAKL